MSGYLDFNRTGFEPFDAVLAKIEEAGDGFHHTAEWQDDIEGGPSYTQQINELITIAYIKFRCLRAEVASLKGKLESANGDILWRDNEIKELREKKFTRFNDKECWLYQGDGQDNLQTLSCPVVIAPEVLLDLTQQLAAVTDEFKAWAGLVKARDEQLAAANGRVELLKTSGEALLRALSFYEIARTAQRDQLQSAAQQLTEAESNLAAALSDLPEVDKEKS